MKAEEHSISQILTEQICYEVPPYQRAYSWGEENTEQLLTDMWGAYQSDDKEYFIGSLITIQDELGRRYEIVDGQQRLTTLNLIFARLRDKIEDAAAKQALGNRILPRNALTGEEEKPRLTLRRKDQAFFCKYVLEGQPFPQSSQGSLELPQRNMLVNVGVIDKFISDKDQKTLRLFADYILTKVYVVFVKTDSFHSAYRLFNVLNARGLSLSNADLIKNMLFSKLNGNDLNSEILEECWIELEETVGIEKLDTFLGHHRTSLKANRARGTMHEEFRAIIDENGADPLKFCDGLIASAKNYVRILKSNFEDNASALRSIHALHRIEYDEWIPPLLAFLNTPGPQFPEPTFLQLLEKITMQNWIRRLGRSARLTVYFQLINAINRRESPDHIYQVFRVNANNNEFENLLNGDIYGLPYAASVLMRLEEATKDESVTKIFGGTITIEHVLPQALKDEFWQQRFSPEVHRFWVHKLGNLTLLSGRKNYKAQYYDFPRKKEVYQKRNDETSFDLTKDVCQERDWTEGILEQRQARMLELGMQLWRIE